MKTDRNLLLELEKNLDIVRDSISRVFSYDVTIPIYLDKDGVVKRGENVTRQKAFEILNIQTNSKIKYDILYVITALDERAKYELDVHLNNLAMLINQLKTLIKNKPRQVEELNIFRPVVQPQPDIIRREIKEEEVEDDDGDDGREVQEEQSEQTRKDVDLDDDGDDIIVEDENDDDEGENDESETDTVDDESDEEEDEEYEMTTEDILDKIHEESQKGVPSTF